MKILKKDISEIISFGDSLSLEVGQKPLFLKLYNRFKEDLKNYYTVYGNKSVNISSNDNYKNLLFDKEIGKDTVLFNRIVERNVKSTYLHKNHYNFILTENPSTTLDEKNTYASTYKDVEKYFKMHVIHYVAKKALMIYGHRKKYYDDLYDFFGTPSDEKALKEYLIKVKDLTVRYSHLTVPNNTTKEFATVDDTNFYELYEKFEYKRNYNRLALYFGYSSTLNKFKNKESLTITNVVNSTYNRYDFVLNILNKISISKEVTHINPHNGNVLKSRARFAINEEDSEQVAKLTVILKNVNDFNEALSSKVKMIVNNNTNDGFIFRTVKGKWINYYYSVNNYENSLYKLHVYSKRNDCNYGSSEDCGTLFNSCMRYPNNYPQIKWYSKNPYASLLILVNPKTDKIIGRCVLWTLNGKKYSDRVFYTNERTRLRFDKYLSENSIKSVYNDGFPEKFQVHYRTFRSIPYFDSFRGNYVYDNENNLFRSNSSNSTFIYNSRVFDTHTLRCAYSGSRDKRRLKYVNVYKGDEVKNIIVHTDYIFKTEVNGKNIELVLFNSLIQNLPKTSNAFVHIDQDDGKAYVSDEAYKKLKELIYTRMFDECYNYIIAPNIIMDVLIKREFNLGYNLYTSHNYTNNLYQTLCKLRKNNIMVSITESFSKEYKNIMFFELKDGSYVINEKVLEKFYKNYCEIVSPKFLDLIKYFVQCFEIYFNSLYQKHLSDVTESNKVENNIRSKVLLDNTRKTYDNVA